MRNEGYLHFVIPLSSINKLQLDSLRKAIKRAGAAHHTDLDIRINGQNERIQADWLKHFREIDLGDEAGPVGHSAVEAQCVHHCLDDRRVARNDSGGKEFSLWGRVCEYMRMYSKEAA